MQTRQLKDIIFYEFLKSCSRRPCASFSAPTSAGRVSRGGRLPRARPRKKGPGDASPLSGCLAYFLALLFQ